MARPLLPFRRNQTEAYCDRHGLTPIADPSNWDRRFLRNRIRHELLQVLETYNPEIRQALLRTSRVMGDVADLLETQVDLAWAGCVRVAGESALAVDTAEFSQQPMAIQRGLLRRIVECLNIPTREAGFEAIERVRAAVLGEAPSRLALPEGFQAERVGAEWLLARPDARAEFPQFPLLDVERELPIPEAGAMALAAGWQLVVERRAANDERLGPLSDATRAVFDLEKFDEPIVLRPRREGERMAPFGMQGTVKLSDVFIDHQVPSRLRGRWPVVAAGEDVLWLAGLRRGRQARVVPSTRRILQLTLVPPAP